MIAHPNRSRSRLAQYGARLRTVVGRKVVELVDSNDNARARHQYRRSVETGSPAPGRYRRNGCAPIPAGGPGASRAVDDTTGPRLGDQGRHEKEGA